MKKAARPKERILTGEAFDALSAEEKEAIYREIDEAPPGKLMAESKPMTAAERKQFARVKKKMGRGRPKVGKGSKVVSVSVESELLKIADAHAKRLGIGRTELFVQGLRLALFHGG